MFLRHTQRRHDAEHGVTTGKSLSSKKPSKAQSNCCHKTVQDKFTNASAQPQISVAVLLKLGIRGSNTTTRTDQIIYYYIVTERQPKITVRHQQTASIQISPVVQSMKPLIIRLQNLLRLLARAHKNTPVFTA